MTWREANKVNLITILAIIFLFLFLYNRTYGFDYGDTIPIWLNVFDTTDGASIPASSAPTIEVFFGTTTIRNATMTQDSAGAYYYNFIAPETTAVYSYAFHWTAQTKNYYVHGGKLQVKPDSVNIDMSSLTSTGFWFKLDTTVWGDTNSTPLMKERYIITAGDTAIFASVQDVAGATRDSLERSTGYIMAISDYLGTYPDTAIQILYPTGGTTPKDSVKIYDVNRNLKKKIVYYHTGSVIDSIKVY